jgi:predicted nucleotide-binding protein (sugar kinase/HSP70/actin superfamily)
MVTIGIPKGMFFYEYSLIWEEFFKSLGFEVILSQDTNRKILDEGVKCCSNETCLPVKVFHGHVMSLKDEVDYVFIPRYQSTGKNEYTCPKMCGLPDMIAANLGNQIRMLEAKIDVDSHTSKTTESLIKLARKLNLKPTKVLETFDATCEKYAQKNVEKSQEGSKKAVGDKLKLILLGHPYMIHDNYISMRLVEKLKSKNIDVLTHEDIDYETKRRNAYPYQGKIFWDIGFELLGSAFTFAKDEKVKGMIYLTPFACGLDAFIMEFIELEIKSSSRKLPILKLTVDEHTGEAGFDTRLEAFIDMIG